MAALVCQPALWVTVNACLLLNIDGLSGLQRVTGRLALTRLDCLKNLDGLATLTSAGAGLIGNNGVLENLDGLRNVSGNLSELWISNNRLLSRSWTIWRHRRDG